MRLLRFKDSDAKSFLDAIIGAKDLPLILTFEFSKYTET